METRIDRNTLNGKERTSRHLLTDEAYAATLAADFGIALTDVKDALIGEPMKRALRVCGWAESVEKSPMKRGQALTRWAKKNKAGIYSGPRGPEGGDAKTPPRREREQFSPEQVMANIDRMAG